MTWDSQKRTIPRILIVLATWVLTQSGAEGISGAIGEPERLSKAALEVKAAPLTQARETTADHRKFEALKREFRTGPEVTKACLSCHTEAARQIHGTIHWTWRSEKAEAAGFGKATAINNF